MKLTKNLMMNLPQMTKQEEQHKQKLEKLMILILSRILDHTMVEKFIYQLISLNLRLKQFFKLNLINFNLKCN